MIDVVQAIKMHPDGEVAKCLRIGAVTCCVDPLNSFMESRFEFEFYFIFGFYCRLRFKAWERVLC